MLGVIGALLPVAVWITGKALTERTRWWSWVIGVGSWAFLAQFFRHPACTTPVDSDLVVAPSFGRVVHIGVESESEMLHEERLQVSIFLSLFNPHLTRSPIPGNVTAVRYHPGKYLVALHPKASTLNERNSILIEHPDGTRIVVRMIAGFVARRICCYVRAGAKLSAGDEIGFIKLGSRVDLFLPVQSEVMVKVGQHVRAGETPLARGLGRHG